MGHDDRRRMALVKVRTMSLLADESRSNSWPGGICGRARGRAGPRCCSPRRRRRREVLSDHPTRQRLSRMPHIRYPDTAVSGPSAMRRGLKWKAETSDP